MASGGRTTSFLRLTGAALCAVVLALGALVIVASPLTAGVRLARPAYASNAYVHWLGDALVSAAWPRNGRLALRTAGVACGMVDLQPGDQLVVTGGWPWASANPVALGVTGCRLSIGARMSARTALVASAHGAWLIGLGGLGLAALALASQLKRIARRRGGRCEGCGYEVGNRGAACPECGAALGRIGA